MEGGKVLGLELRGEGDVNLGVGGYGYGLLETVVNFLAVLIL